MKIKTNELSGIALDWAVAKAQVKVEGRLFNEGFDPNLAGLHPSSDWSQGGPIIERERIDVAPLITSGEWAAFYNVKNPYEGETPLIAAMRCYVASKLGEEVEIPDELVED